MQQGDVYHGHNVNYYIYNYAGSQGHGPEHDQRWQMQQSCNGHAPAIGFGEHDEHHLTLMNMLSSMLSMRPTTDRLEVIRGQTLSIQALSIKRIFMSPDLSRCHRSLALSVISQIRQPCLIPLIPYRNHTSAIFGHRTYMNMYRNIILRTQAFPIMGLSTVLHWIIRLHTPDLMLIFLRIQRQYRHSAHRMIRQAQSSSCNSRSITGLQTLMDISLSSTINFVTSNFH